MRPRVRIAPVVLLALLCVLSLSTDGCATRRSRSASSSGPAAPAGDVEVVLSLKPGQAWKSRFVATSEMKRTLKGADGKEAVKARSVGIELVSTQTVVSVADGKATIEVRESAARILQDGKFIDHPVRQFDPPNPFRFTLDLGTGKTDFSGMEKAYADWMAGVKEGPAGEILGKSFRLDSYVAQLKEQYGKPFRRFAGKTLSKASRTAGEREFLLPFLGPAVAIGPVPVETTMKYEPAEAKGGGRQLKVDGRYEGRMELSAEDLKARLADFGAAAPASFLSSGEARGHFSSLVDAASGREIGSTSQVAFKSSATFEGGALTEEIAGKSILEPVD